MTEHLRAYNSLWQVRSDSWCRLEEAADRLTRPTTTGELKEQIASLPGPTGPSEHAGAVLGLSGLAAIRQGSAAFRRRQLRQVRASGGSDQPRADHGVVPHRATSDNAGARRTDMFPADPRQLEQQPATQTRPALLRSARRRKDDRSPGTGAAQRGAQMAASRRRIRLRAGGGVQRRRGADRRAAQRQPAGRGDPAALLAPIDPGPVDAGGVRRRRGVRRAGRPPVARRTRADPGGFAGETCGPNSTST